MRRGLARSRGQARELIDSGLVLLDGRVVAKPALPVPEAADLAVSGGAETWVSRAAYKLLAALEAFGPQGLRVQGRRCLDVGASTGGFTQVLLHHGADARHRPRRRATASWSPEVAARPARHRAVRA